MMKKFSFVQAKGRLCSLGLMVGALLLCGGMSMPVYAGNAVANDATGTWQQAGSVKVTGQVLDEFGMGVPGANVVVKGQSGIGCVTDLDGKFTLEVPRNST